MPTLRREAKYLKLSPQPIWRTYIISSLLSTAPKLVLYFLSKTHNTTIGEIFRPSLVLLTNIYAVQHIDEQATQESTDGITKRTGSNHL